MIKFPASLTPLAASPRPERMRRTRNAASVAAMCFLASCAAPRKTHEPWVYVMSRYFYSDMGDSGELFASLATDCNSEGAAVAALCVFALPFALDTVLLPVTIPHDMVWVK